jgi:hypothetical protein
MSHVFRFRIRAVSDAQTLSRVINLFAQRGLIPNSVRCRTFMDIQKISITVSDADLACATIIAEKMRATFLVEDVELS